MSNNLLNYYKKSVINSNKIYKKRKFSISKNV